VPYAIPPAKVKIAEATFEKITITPSGEGAFALVVTDYAGVETRIILREDGLLDAQMIEVGQPRRLLTVKEYAKLVGRSPSTVRRWIRQKKIRAIKLSNGQYVIPREQG